MLHRWCVRKLRTPTLSKLRPLLFARRRSPSMKRKPKWLGVGMLYDLTSPSSQMWLVER